MLSQRTTIDNRIEADGAADEADADEDDGGEDVIDLPIARATIVTSRYTASSPRELPVRSASHTAAASSSSLYDQHQQQQRQPYQSPSPVTKPRSAGAAYPLYDERSSPRDASSSSSPSTSLHASMTSYFGTARSDITPISSAQTSRASYQQPSRADVTDADSLQCPKCQMSFKANDHLSLLEHINECVS